MSETKPETKKDETATIVEDTLAGAQSLNIILRKQVDELTAAIDIATTKLKQMEEVEQSHIKAQLIADIEHRYEEPKELLILRSIDELKTIKHVLDKTPATLFKSGTPVAKDRSNLRQKLDSKFDLAQKRRMEAN